MSPSALTSENSAIVMIDHAVGFGNVFRSRFAAAIESAGRRKLVMFGLLIAGCVMGTAMAGLKLGYDVYDAVDATACETLETHLVAVQRMIQAEVVPVTWLSLASQYQRRYASHETVPEFLGLMAQHSPALGMLFQGRQPV